MLAILQLFFNKRNSPIRSFLIPTPTITDIIYKPENSKVIRVIDGDTIEIEGKQKVRYIGVNSPELHDPRRPIECFGQAASDENKKLVEGKTVRLEKDVSEKDKYGRLLRYVYLDPPTSSEQAIFVNDYLVRQGFAQVSTYQPDVKYVDLLLDAQKEAKENSRGLWSQCPIK